MLDRRLLLVGLAAATTAGCAAAQRTDILRKDVRTDAQNAIADARLAGGDLTLDAALDRPDATYDPGQPITLTVRTDKDAYVAILRVLANGETTIVFPNRAHSSAALKANTPLIVPAAGDKITIAADQPGIVMFEVIATTVGTSWLFSRAPDDGSDFAHLGVTTRDIAKDLISTLKVGGPNPTAAMHLTLRITGRSLL